jgi:hypothetical protein
MALKKRLKTLEGVEAAIAALYVKSGEEFVLDVDGGFDDADGLKSALTKERTLRAAAESEASSVKVQLEKFKTIDPAKYEELVAMEEDIRTKGKGWEKMKEQLNAAHQEELRKRDERNQSLSATLEDALIGSAAAAEIEKAGGSTLLLLPHVKSRAKLVEENGKHHVRLFDDKGDPLIDNQGAYLTLGGFVTQLKTMEGYGTAFKASGASGGGAPPSGGNNGGGSPGGLDRAKMTLQEKNAYMEKHGVEAYNALPMTLPSQQKAAATGGFINQ